MVDNIVGRGNCDRNHEDQDDALRKKESDAQRAIDETGFGQYNYKVIAVGGMVYMNVSLGIPNLGFVLLSAACDFHIDTVRMDRLIAAQIFGIMCGSCLWGCVAYTKGRRTALLSCLFFQAFLDSLSSVSLNYWVFLILKLFTGLSLSGQMATVFAYTAEFQPSQHRTTAMAITAVFCIVGAILSPMVARLIIPLDIDITYRLFSFKSWNLLVILMSAMPALIVGCVLLKMSETPKYLAATERYIELREVLTDMYCRNTGNAAEEYIVNLDKRGIAVFTNAIDDTDVHPSQSGGRALETFFRTLRTQTRMLVTQPYIARTLMSFTANSIIVSIYTVTLWFPEIFQRLANHEIRYPGERADICLVPNSTVHNVSLLMQKEKMTIADSLESRDCVATIENHVYFEALILGLSCIPPSIIFIFIVSRYGFQFFLALNSFIICAVAFSLIFVSSNAQTVTLACIWEALISISVTAMSGLLVEIYPTHLRVAASALAVLLGRFSAFVGNIIFSCLLDSHCAALFTLLAVELFVCGVLCAVIPKEDNVQRRATV